MAFVRKVDNVDDVMAADVNELQAAIESIYSTPLVITASTTFDKADYTDLLAIRVRIVGGGGGGGGVAGNAAGAACGQGGAGGEYAEKLILAADLLASETVTIGAGGAAGAAGNNAGAAGGDTSFGAHITATGGGGGNGQANQSSFPAPGAFVAGAAGTGGAGTADLRIAGGDPVNGIVWSATSVQSSFGGSTPFSMPARLQDVSTTDEAGRAGTGYGGGATGARSSSNATDRAGGAGAAGVCIIEIYKAA
jgi:hypothetical protein